MSGNNQEYDSSAEFENIDLTEEGLDNVIKVKSLDGNGLLEAAETGDINWLSDCLNANVNIHVIDINNYYETALHIAVSEGHLECVSTLINNGANISAQTSYNETPLHYAILYEHVDIARILINHGANVNAQDYYGRTPLHYALEAQSTAHIECTELLLKNNANPHIVNNERVGPYNVSLVKNNQCLNENYQYFNEIISFTNSLKDNIKNYSGVLADFDYTGIIISKSFVQLCFYELYNSLSDKIEYFNLGYTAVLDTSDIKLHKVKARIPIRNFSHQGLYVLSIIKKLELRQVVAAKLFFPNNITGMLEPNTFYRLVTNAPITIYFDVRATAKQISEAIKTIDSKLLEVANILGLEFNTVAVSDIDVTTTCGLTIDSKHDRLKPGWELERKVAAQRNVDIKEIMRQFVPPAPAHSLFLPLGYELAVMPENFYKGGQRKQGQLYPKQGVFYIELKENTLDYIVIGSDKQFKHGQITLKQYNSSNKPAIESWPSTDNLDDYVSLLPRIWQITADKKHTIPNAQYRKSRGEEYPSNHLLISGQAGDYNILSWNTMGAGAAGFSASQDESSIARRHTQIITILTEAATAQNASIIHLQETNVDAKKLKESLGDNWTVIDSVDYCPYENEENKDQRDIGDATKNRVITCYRHDKFTAGEIISETVSRSQHRYLKVELTDKHTCKTTDCYNICTIYNDFPDEHEKMYRGYINASKAKGHDVIIAGDSRACFMPADATQKNITTALISPKFLRDHPSYVASDGSCQISNYTDTILHYSCDENKVSQPVFNAINKQGQIHEEPVPNLDNVPDYELAMRKEYRAVFSIDALCGNKKSVLLALESNFLKNFSEQITVRETANSLNERGIIFRFPKKDSKLYKVFEKFQQAYPAIKYEFYQSQVGETRSKQFFCFSVPAELKGDIVNYLQSQTRLNLIIKLQGRIVDREVEFKNSENKPFNSTFGRLASKVGLAYTYKQKMAAANALLKAIIENKPIDKEHLEVLSQGRLADVFFECRDRLPGFESLLPSDLKPSFHMKPEAMFGRALFNNRGNENSQSEIANNTNESTSLLN